MQKTLLQILGFAVMAFGLQGAIRLLANDDAGLLGWINADTSLLLGINVVISLCGIYLFSWAQKQSR